MPDSRQMRCRNTAVKSPAVEIGQSNKKAEHQKSTSPAGGAASRATGAAAHYHTSREISPKAWLPVFTSIVSTGAHAAPLPPRRLEACAAYLALSAASSPAGIPAGSAAARGAPFHSLPALAAGAPSTATNPSSPSPLDHCKACSGRAVHCRFPHEADHHGARSVGCVCHGGSHIIQESAACARGRPWARGFLCGAAPARAPAQSGQRSLRLARAPVPVPPALADGHKQHRRSAGGVRASPAGRQQLLKVRSPLHLAVR